MEDKFLNLIPISIALFAFWFFFLRKPKNKKLYQQRVKKPVKSRETIESKDFEAGGGLILPSHIADSFGLEPTSLQHPNGKIYQQEVNGNIYYFLATNAGTRKLSQKEIDSLQKAS